VLTYAGLAKIADKLNDANATLINHDFNTIYTDYLKDVAVNIFAQLIYDHHVPEMVTGKYVLSISNCYISFLSGIQPQLYAKLSRSTSFESMYKDRFIRMFMIYPLGKPNGKKYPPKITPLNLDFMDVREPWKLVTIPEYVLKNDLYERFRRIMTYHTSPGRAPDFTDRLLASSALIEGRDKVLYSDLKFLSLYIPYIYMEKWMSHRYRGASQPLQFDPDAYTVFEVILMYSRHGSVSVRQLMEEFQMSRKTIMNNIKPLKANRLIRGFKSRTDYIPHPEWMEKYINPILDFMKIIKKEGLK